MWDDEWGSEVMVVSAGGRLVIWEDDGGERRGVIGWRQEMGQSSGVNRAEVTTVAAGGRSQRWRGVKRGLIGRGLETGQS